MPYKFEFNPTETELKAGYHRTCIEAGDGETPLDALWPAIEAFLLGAGFHKNSIDGLFETTSAE